MKPPFMRVSLTTHQTAEHFNACTNQATQERQHKPPNMTFQESTTTDQAAIVDCSKTSKKMNISGGTAMSESAVALQESSTNKQDVADAIAGGASMVKASHKMKNLEISEVQLSKGAAALKTPETSKGALKSNDTAETSKLVPAKNKLDANSKRAASKHDAGDVEQEQKLDQQKQNLKQQQPPRRQQRNNNDPHELIDRFVEPQSTMFASALSEIRDLGYKQSCWVWFVLPTPPFRDPVSGQEMGSRMNRRYALRTKAQVRAYLQLPTQYPPSTDEDDEIDPMDISGHSSSLFHLPPRPRPVNLRKNYIAILTAILQALRKRNDSAKRRRGRLMGSNSNSSNNNKILIDIMGHGDAAKTKSSVGLFHRIAKEMGDNELACLCHDFLSLVEEPRAVTRTTPSKRPFRLNPFN